MFITCSFRHEELPEEVMVELEMEGNTTKVCPRCLVLIAIHRRYHHMKLEKLIPEMSS